MKITDVTLTLFAWDNIPSTTYGSHTGQFAGNSALGLLRLITDQGIEGHAFLGTSSNPASPSAFTRSAPRRSLSFQPVSSKTPRPTARIRALWSVTTNPVPGAG